MEVQQNHLHLKPRCKEMYQAGCYQYLSIQRQIKSSTVFFRSLSSHAIGETISKYRQNPENHKTSPEENVIKKVHTTVASASFNKAPANALQEVGRTSQVLKQLPPATHHVSVIENLCTMYLSSTNVAVSVTLSMMRCDFFFHCNHLRGSALQSVAFCHYPGWGDASCTSSPK